jgi:hypothetical protein
MRLPRMTTRRWMIVVAVVALFLLPAVYLWQIWQNWRAYSAWASNPTRAIPYHVPYPSAGRWPY